MTRKYIWTACLVLATAISSYSSAVRAGTETLISQFTGLQGPFYPLAPTIGLHGKLYGTTFYGGTGPCGSNSFYGCGTAYTIFPDGRTKVIYAFQGGPDGAGPTGQLVELGGLFYGIASAGGSANCGPNGGCGVVFSLSRDGTETVLHTFAGGSDGVHPNGPLVKLHGVLYGVTASGGGLGGKHCYNEGCGIVFSITPDGTYRQLYVFRGGDDGAIPFGSMAIIQGTLYGTTIAGGNGNCGAIRANGCGTVFSLTPGGVYKLLYAFQYSPDGASPNGLLNVHDVLYGTTERGGTGDGNCVECGTAFSVTTTGVETVLYSFGASDNDGYLPSGGLAELNGVLYGTTSRGGQNDAGILYSLTLTGDKTLRHSFGGTNDGVYPASGLSVVEGNLYGTTIFDTSPEACKHNVSGCGAVFEYSP